MRSQIWDFGGIADGRDPEGHPPPPLSIFLRSVCCGVCVSWAWDFFCWEGPERGRSICGYFWLDEAEQLVKRDAKDANELCVRWLFFLSSPTYSGC